MPDVKLSQLAAASAASVAAGAGLWTMAGHMLGLGMEYVGPAAVRVTSGSAWIPSLQRAVEVPSALTLSGLSLTPSTWYHLFLYMNGATPAIEAVTTVPAAPYSGTARAKNGDPSRRYIGSFKTGSTGQILKFVHVPADNSVAYNESIGGAPFVVVNGSTQTVPTTADCSAVVPLTSRRANAVILNAATSSSAYLHLSNSDGPTPGAGGGFLGLVSPLSVGSTPVTLDATQRYNFAYEAAVGGGGCFHRISGYVFDR